MVTIRIVPRSLRVYRPGAGGYYVEYTAPPGGSISAAHLSRVSRFLDTDALRNLMIDNKHAAGRTVQTSSPSTLRVVARVMTS